LKNLVVLGDFNTARFYHFTIVNWPREITFRDTGESLDHCLILPSSKITCSTAEYYHEQTLSDHTPVLFSLCFSKS
jgi:endonuclease/exonuclease/phosphatase family metal-dependent hydrolase